MNPRETIARMSRVMKEALARVDQGSVIHGREAKSLMARGLVRHHGAGLVVTGHGDEVLKLIRKESVS